MTESLNVLVISDLSAPPERYDCEELLKTDPNWKTERDVIRIIKKLGHNPKLLVLYDDVEKLIQEIKDFRPDLTFNLAESFNNKRVLASPLLGVLDLLGVPYTGATPQTLMLCNNKATTKKILLHHGVKTPDFKTAYLNKPLPSLKNFLYPAIVKPLKSEGSEGISQSSFVKNEKECLERVKFVHEKMKSAALIEEYIDGREIYVSVMGKPHYEVLSIREMCFKKIPDEEPKIATHHAKFSKEYRDKWGIQNEKARWVSEKLKSHIKKTGKKVCQLLQIEAYARIDMRLTPQDEIYVLEVNPNPDIAQWEDFAWAADDEGIKYPQLIEKILFQGLSRKAPSKKIKTA